MADYLVYKVEIFNPEGGGHTSNQVKYFCEPQGITHHGYTDDNPHRLFGKIASFFKVGDTIRTISTSEITGSVLGEVPASEHSESFVEVQAKLREPLSHDELRILTVQVLEALDSANNR